MIDAKKNRQAKKYTRNELIARILWSSAYPLFRWSPRIMWGWRRMILRAFGAKVGLNSHIYPTAKIFMPWNVQLGDYTAIGDEVRVYALGKITIGDRSVVSQRAHLCAGDHDINDPSRPLLKLPINIGDDVWIAADSFIGPKVNIGNQCIIGACSVVIKNIPDGSLAVGHPAKIVRKLSDEK